MNMAKFRTTITFESPIEAPDAASAHHWSRQLATVMVLYLDQAGYTITTHISVEEEAPDATPPGS